MKKKILLVQPIVPHYRVKIFSNLAKYVDLTIASEDLNNQKGFISKKISKNIKIIKSKKINFFLFFQTNIIKNIIKNKYDKVILSCDIKNMTNFFVLILCKILNIKCFIWGHGLFGKSKKIPKSLIYRFYYFFINYFITKYIAYNKYSKDTLLKVLGKKKIIVIDNTLEKKFIFIKKNYKEKNILFVGRLRNRCMLNILIKAMVIINRKFKNIRLEIIGYGNLFDEYKSLAKKLNINCIFYKQKTNFKKISKKCFLGVYPGDAGLSVVEYMMLNLPVIKHDIMDEHMGPETSYIRNNYNGLTYKKGSVEDLANNILKIFLNKKLRKKFSKNSYKTIVKINKKPFSKKFADILVR